MPPGWHAGIKCRGNGCLMCRPGHGWKHLKELPVVELILDICSDGMDRVTGATRGAGSQQTEGEARLGEKDSDRARESLGRLEMAGIPGNLETIWKPWVSQCLPKWIVSSRRSGTGNVRSEPCSPPTGATILSASFSCGWMCNVEICWNHVKSEEKSLQYHTISMSIRSKSA